MTLCGSDPQLELHLLRGKTKAIVCLRGELTTDTVYSLANLSPRIGDVHLVELDLSDLRGIDDDGVRALQFLERRLAVKGRLFLVSHPQPMIRRSLYRGGMRSQLAPSFPRRRVTSVMPMSGFGSDAPQAG